MPRETSPIDLGEVFQGHVERAMLLDDSADNSSGMSLNRWPQYVLVAAIAILTLGLGAVLVAILKAPGQTGQGTVAIQNKAIAPVSRSGVSSTTAPAGLVAQPGGPFVPLAVGPIQSAPQPPLATDATRGAHLDEAVGGKSLDKMMARRAQADDRSEIDSLKSRLNSAGVRVPLDQKTVFFVVSADAPASTVDQVRGFFDRHQIAFDSSPVGKIENTPNTNQGIAFGNVQGGGGGEAPGNANTNGREQLAPVPKAGLNQNLAGGSNANQQFAQSTPSAAATSNGTVNNAENNNRASDNAAMKKMMQQNAMPQGAGNQSNVTNNAPQSLLNSLADKDKISALTPAAPPEGETYYIAHGVTPLQIELLNASLLSDSLKQTVQRLTLSSGPVEELAKQDGAISKGQTLTVTIPQLVGPGIEKTNVVKVAEDGSISLPMIDPLPATGVLPVDLQQRITDKYREANLIPAATVTVAVAAPPATTQSVGGTTQPAKEAATATTLPVARAAPATHPAVDPSLVDVVVVIQPSRFPPPTVVPAPSK